MITTEEAEKSAHTIETLTGLSLHSHRIRSLAAERDRLREALRKARARYVELNDKGAAEATVEIITEALGDGE